MKGLAFALAASVVTCLPLLASARQGKESAATIDHFILAINDLDRGVAEFERMTGVRPVFGGVHPGRGTQNALASLGDGRYIEILAPNPAETNPERPIDGLKAMTKLTPAGWALATTDIEALRRRAEAAGVALSPTMGGSRALPDGSRLEWRTLGVTSPTHQWAPFFIQWVNPALQPSRTSPTGCTLASVALQVPDPSALRKVFDAVGFTMTLNEGNPQQMTITLACPAGTVTFK